MVGRKASIKNREWDFREFVAAPYCHLNIITQLKYSGTPFNGKPLNETPLLVFYLATALFTEKNAFKGDKFRYLLTKKPCLPSKWPLNELYMDIYEQKSTAYQTKGMVNKVYLDTY